MKLLKKISLVYILQIFAVILLFGYAVATPVNKTKESVTDNNMPLELNKQAPVTADKDSVFPINTRGIFTAKSRN